MNGTITLRNLAVAGITCLLAAACSDTDDGSRLPDGQYPMTFTAAVDGLTATRAAGKDTWTLNDQIAISVDGGVSSKKYKITNASSGAMEPAVTGDGYYWQNSQENKTILAWYPAKDIANVDISDQSSGFSAFDYLKTESTTAGFGSDVALSFKHQMAKVKYTLAKGEGITDDELNAATVTISGYTNASFSKGTVSGDDNGWIEPTVENASSGEALVVPQQMQGKQFIKVTIGDKAYYYIPKGVDNGNLRAGYIENYTITVKQSGLSVLWQEGEQIDDTAEEATFKIHLKDFTAPEHTSGYSVTDADGVPITATSGVYTLAGNELNISLSAADNYRLKTFLTKVTAGFCKQRGSYAAATRTYTYTFRDIRSDLFLDDIQADAEEATSPLPQLKAGDYYYADGTWSSTLTKPCIGIVFKAGAGQDDQASDYNSLVDNAIHGYAVALNDAHIAAGAWGIRQVDVSDIENNDGSAGTKYDGYKNTTVVRKLSAYRSTDVSQPTANGQYWAFKVASEYGITAPDNTSGWYLPSIQQLADICSLSELATRLTAAGGADFRQARYWSSTEKSGYDAWYYQFDGKGAAGYAKSNDGGNYLRSSYVRAILTF